MFICDFKYNFFVRPFKSINYVEREREREREREKASSKNNECFIFTKCETFNLLYYFKKPILTLAG